MKRTGSRARYELYGAVAIAPGAPSFGLPLFRSAQGAELGQTIDEATGRIRSFEKVALEGASIIPIKRSSNFQVGDSPALCLILENGTAEGGTRERLKECLEKILHDAQTSLSVRLQAAGFVDTGEERRLRNSLSWHPSNAAISSLRAYNRSVGRIILWDKLVKAAKTEDVVLNTLRARPQLDLDVHDNGMVVLHIEGIRTSDYPSIDFQTLAFDISQDLSAAIASNDAIETDSPEEAVFSITPLDLKSFLDRRIGSDARISGYTYSWTVELLRSLGFSNLDQVDEAISGYNSARLSYAATGALQGQATKFEFMLLAALGNLYIERHMWAANIWFGARERRLLSEFEERGIVVKNYDPLCKRSPPP